MSDREGHSGGVPGTDEDLSLPKATVAKMIAGALVINLNFSKHLTRFCVGIELLPNDLACAKETRDLVIECCVGESCPTILYNTPC
jgi:hypothetical protein